MMNNTYKLYLYHRLVDKYEFYHNFTLSDGCGDDDCMSLVWCRITSLDQSSFKQTLQTWRVISNSSFKSSTLRALWSIQSAASYRCLDSASDRGELTSNNTVVWTVFVVLKGMVEVMQFNQSASVLWNDLKSVSCAHYFKMRPGQVTRFFSFRFKCKDSNLNDTANATLLFVCFLFTP